MELVSRWELVMVAQRLEWAGMVARFHLAWIPARTQYLVVDNMGWMPL